MDNRHALAALNLSQQAWGRLWGVNPRTVRRWFKEPDKAPKLVWPLLRYFAANPRAFKAFERLAQPASGDE